MSSDHPPFRISSQTRAQDYDTKLEAALNHIRKESLDCHSLEFKRSVDPILPARPDLH